MEASGPYPCWAIFLIRRNHHHFMDGSSKFQSLEMDYRMWHARVNGSPDASGIEVLLHQVLPLLGVWLWQQRTRWRFYNLLTPTPSKAPTDADSDFGNGYKQRHAVM